MPSNLETTPAIVTQVADAVLEALNGGEFSEDLAEEREVERFETPEEALDKLTAGKVRIAVLCEAARRKSLTRRSKQIECDISVAIIRKLTDKEDAKLAGDRMQKLAEEIADLLEDEPLACDLNVSHQDTTIRLLYSPKHLRENTVHMLPTTYTYLVKT